MPCSTGSPCTAPKKTEARLLFAVGDHDGDPELRPGAFDQLLTVARLAHGRRRDGHRALRTGAGGHRDKAAHDVQRPLDRLGLEQPLAADVADQSQRAARIAQHVQVRRPVDARHHHPTAI